MLLIVGLRRVSKRATNISLITSSGKFLKDDRTMRYDSVVFNIAVSSSRRLQSCVSKLSIFDLTTANFPLLSTTPRVARCFSTSVGARLVVYKSSEYVQEKSLLQEIFERHAYLIRDAYGVHNHV